jgi:lysophospholipase L1-like esterase
MKRYLILFAFIQLLIQPVFAQTKPRFWDDVQTIKKYDGMFKPPVNPVLFVGSSSIRKWDDLTQVFASYNALNRGVGGTIINDITFYLNDIVFPYKPRQIILYVGENDIVDEKTTADSVLNRTVALYKAIRLKLPTVPIAYISIKPSPSRDQFRDKAVQSNLLIKKFLSGEKNTVFIDIFPQMLNKDGSSRKELFVGDMLHMNPDGYAIWQKAVKPYLIKNGK